MQQFSMKKEITSSEQIKVKTEHKFKNKLY